MTLTSADTPQQLRTTAHKPSDHKKGTIPTQTQTLRFPPKAFFHSIETQNGESAFVWLIDSVSFLFISDFPWQFAATVRAQFTFFDHASGLAGFCALPL